MAKLGLAVCSKRKTNGRGVVQMKVVTARATSVTGCEQSFDEVLRSTSARGRNEQASGRGPSWSRARTEWGDVLPCWGSCKARCWVK